MSSGKNNNGSGRREEQYGLIQIKEETGDTGQYGSGVRRPGESF